MKSRVKVLVVDDSLLFRTFISKGICTDPALEVVATATDPFDARDKIIRYDPDVMVCDVEMPRMNGIEFLRRLLPQHPLPVVIVSAVSQAVFEAMSVGAVDFMTKPDMNALGRIEPFVEELIQKIHIAVKATVVSPSIPGIEPAPYSEKKNTDKKLIAIGASTGGTEAIHNLLKMMQPERYPGLVIVQHIPPVFSAMFAERLNRFTSWTVKEAETGDIIGPGRVLMAPGDRHIRIKKFGSDYQVVCSQGEKVSGHCPSVDVLFESVAKEAGKEALGVILTGMGYDGARGMLAMRRKGARTIGQDEDSSVVYGMPRAAYELGAVEKQAALKSIPRLIDTML
ncbi:chemotaxis response regulator protein-glutamate methylesterase [Paenibacillus sp. YSY-4.3]